MIYEPNRHIDIFLNDLQTHSSQTQIYVWSLTNRLLLCAVFEVDTQKRKTWKIKRKVNLNVILTKYPDKMSESVRDWKRRSFANKLC